MREMYWEMPARSVKDEKMNKESRNFIIIFVISAIMFIGVIVENVQMALKPEAVQVEVDVEEVRQKIHAAGLTPREAMHWKNIN